MIKSILAGLMISVGCVSFLSVENKIAGTFLFSLGLYTIIILKFDLFTGKVGYLSTNRTLAYLKYLGQVWLGNLIGCVLGAAAIAATRLTISTSTLVGVKYADNLPSLLVLGIFCGMLMFIGVEGYKRTTNPLIVVLPVMGFILCGFEHCVADMFYFAFNFFKSGVTLAGIGDTLLRLVFITIGNLIGGCLLCFASINIQKDA
ncbi:MAG: formate/nitrite transporter family protein [Fibrobacter sp.]|nr:formate/nitrite transporter family protein [Fibrobacter sp.]